MRYRLLLVLLFLSILAVKAQVKRDSILIQKLGIKYSFVQSNETLNTHKVLKLMKSNPDAYEQMFMSEVYHIVFYPMLMLSAGMLAIPIYVKVVYNVLDIRLFAGGLAIGMLAGLASNTSKHKAMHAVSLYNKELNEIGSRNIELKFLVNTRGLGLYFIF